MSDGSINFFMEESTQHLAPPWARAVIYNGAPALAAFALFITVCADLFIFRNRTRTFVLSKATVQKVLWISRVVLFALVSCHPFPSSCFAIRETYIIHPGRRFCACLHPTVPQTGDFYHHRSLSMFS